MNNQRKPDFTKYVVREISKVKISRRQKQIYHLLVCGLSLKDIALLLGIAEKTIKCHTVKMYKKLTSDGSKQLIADLFNVNVDSYKEYE